MNRPLTPGLYRKPIDPQRAVRQLLRADIPVLLGYTDRGPVGKAVRLRTLRQFEAIFSGGPGHLWDGVKGFFETGGDAAYVIRIATASARAADLVQAPTPVTWRAEASFAWPLIDPRRLQGSTLPGALPWVALFEATLRETGRRSADPGSWGNALSLHVARTSQVQTETLEGVSLHEGRASMVTDLTGLEAASILQLSQRVTLPDGSRATLGATVIPNRIDAARQMVHWPMPLQEIDAGAASFDPLAPIRLESVEFDFEVIENGRIVQTLSGLSPNPVHSRAIAEVFTEDCKSLACAPVVQRNTGTTWELLPKVASDAVIATADWTKAENWPLEGDFALSGGADGLQDLAVSDYEAALNVVAKVPEAAMIAAPDLVLQESLFLPTENVTPGAVDCHDLSPPPENFFNGKVTDVDTAGAVMPLASVTIDPAGAGKTVRSAADGSFSLKDLAAGLVSLRLSKPGYVGLEYLAHTSPFASTPEIEIPMTPVSRPKVFGRDAILQVQGMMANPAVVGPYKVAILDIPAPEDRLQDILTWRAKLGDLQRAGLFGPWLRQPSTGAEGAGGWEVCPASAHVCGTYASAENALGVHRSGANLPLRHVEGTTLPLSEAKHGLLNQAQVNAMVVPAGRGIRCGGARSLSADPAWLYLSTRRIVDTLERTLERALKPIVFEPNNIFTRQAVTVTANSLLNAMWTRGILAGAAAEEAYTVKCDLENNPDESREQGRLVVDIGVAPVSPLEFVFFRIGHERDITKVTEDAT